MAKMPLSKKGLRPLKSKKAPKKYNMAAIVKQVKKLSIAANNIEEKEALITNGITTVWLGQVVYNSANFFALDVTPTIGQGTTDGTRIGAQLTVKRAIYRMQMIAQDNVNTNCNVKVQLVYVKGPSVTPSTLVNQMYHPNPFIYTSSFVNAGIVDYNSDYDPDYKKNYRVLMTKYIKIPQETHTTARNVIDVKFSHSFKNHDIFFDGNTNTVQNGQLVLIMLASAGNTSGSLSTLGGIPAPQGTTGYTMGYNIRTFYTDA